MRPIHPSELSPDQIRRELSRILAIGLLRLHKQRRLVGSPTESPLETSQESAATRLEFSEKTVLSGHTS